MLIPQSRLDQLALARNVMHKCALGVYAPGPQMPNGVSLRLLVPHYDMQADKVRMFDVVNQNWIKDELRPCKALRERATQHAHTDLLPVDRVQPTQFWLDTLIWLYQTRRAIVLGANELAQQTEQLAQSLACPQQATQVLERFAPSGADDLDAQLAYVAPIRQVMRG